MKPKFSFIDSELAQIKNHNLYRKLRYGQVSGSKIQIHGKILLNLCSNDYLGIPTRPTILKQLQSSSRLVSGNDKSFEILEKKLAKHKSQEVSLIFPTGYMANLGAIATLANKNDLILSDELNHASIIEACKLSGAKTLVYKHNNMKDLSLKLKHKGKNKFIVTEGIFSMDGDFSELKTLTEIAQKENTITILDDAHGDFAVGNDGKGTAQKFNVTKKIDLYISSLSKGLGSFGGYIASNKKIIDYCINKSKSFIYTSALPSAFLEHSIKRFDFNREKQRKKLEKNTKNMIKGLKQLGYEIRSETHIIPIIIGNEKTAMKYGKFLFNNGIYAQPIRYPTVKKGQARIRMSITAWLSNNEIENALSIFEDARKKFKL